MRATQKDKRGAALFTILAIVFTTSAIMGVTMAASMQRAFMARKLSDRIHAKVIAEAGANEAYARLVTNFQDRDNADAFPKTPYADGAYDVGLQNVSPYVSIIHCTGYYGSAVAEVILDVKNYVDGLPGSESEAAYTYAVVSNGDTTWAGDGFFSVSTKLHANSRFKISGNASMNANVSSSVKIEIKGGASTIDGNIAAPWIHGSTKNVTGTAATEPVPQVDIPNIDLTPYYNMALSNGEVYDGPLTLTEATVPAGGIMWVNGDLSLSGSGTLTGCFIATGDIHLVGSSDQVQVEDFPAFVSRDGDINLAGNGDYEGLVYAKIGNVDLTGSGTLSGSIIAGGDVYKAGASTIITYEDSTPTAPGEDATENSTLAVTAWQK
jgi:hypothetical protein